MKEILNFLIKVNKLKEVIRTGWIIWRIKNPETIAEHTFRVCFLSWLLGAKKNLNIKKIIKIALFHDLCEVYAGDIPPLFYYQNLDIWKKEDEKILMKGIRLSKREKEKRAKIKFKKEKKGLLKLILCLRENLKKEIFHLWMDQEKGFSREGRFVKQVDWIENLIQSIEYLGIERSGSGWWEIAEEKVVDPLLLEFLEVIQKRFYHLKIEKSKNTKELENILDFVLEVGKLKRMQRKGWILRKVKNPETMAGHIFTTTLMTWLFSKSATFTLKSLNEEKLLKMALAHEICEVYARDETPYDRILKGKNEEEKKNILKKWIRLSKKEKSEIFLKDYQKEKKAIEKLTSNFKNFLKKEIIQLWEEFKSCSSSEGRFLNQIDVLAILFQACLYWQKDKKFPIEGLWEWAYEFSDSQINFEFMEELKKKFLRKKLLFKSIIKKLIFFNFRKK